MFVRIIAVLAACAAWIALSGCAAVGPALGDPGTDAVAYTLELVPGPPAAVRVTLRARGETDGTSRLAMAPSWGGVENCERFVHDLVVRDEEGIECPVESNPAEPHGWNVAHKPGAVLTAAYELRPAKTDPLARFGTHYEPVIRDDLVHLIGQTSLVYPQWLEERGPIDIRFDWSGFREQGWTTATSFDRDHGRIRRPLSEFRHAMFLAGRIRAVDRDIQGGQLRVAIHGDWPFADSEMADMVEQIVTLERGFMRDFTDPYFLVTLVPTGPRMSEQSFSMGGTGLTSCFALFMAPGTAIAPGSSGRGEVLRLLAHEYFHTWNGGKLGMEEPEELVYWFSEGFTDFYASRLLRRAGLIDDADWTARTNRAIKSLWLSLVATAPAEAIRREFWSSREMQQLPYHRGEAVALILDEEIRRASGGAKSLDDFMRELLADAQGGERAQTEKLLARISRWTSPEAAEAIRRVVVDGALPELPARISEPGAERADAESCRYDPGFDIDASIAAKSARAVRDGGPAHAAGLRENQAIKGFSIYHGDTDRPIELKLGPVGDAPGQSISFLPRGDRVRIPAYRLP